MLWMLLWGIIIFSSLEEVEGLIKETSLSPQLAEILMAEISLIKLFDHHHF